MNVSAGYFFLARTARPIAIRNTKIKSFKSLCNNLIGDAFMYFILTFSFILDNLDILDILTFLSFRTLLATDTNEMRDSARSIFEVLLFCFAMLFPFYNGKRDSSIISDEKSNFEISEVDLLSPQTDLFTNGSIIFAERQY